MVLWTGLGTDGRRRAAHAVRGLLIVSALFLAAGCGDDSVSPPEEDPGPIGIATDVKTPEAFFASYRAAWQAQDGDVYAALLADRFQFWVRDDDAGQFPWAPLDFWDRTEELGMVTNMLDDGFAEGAPIETVRFEFSMIGQRLKTDATQAEVTEVTVDVVIEVATGPNDGFRSDTRLLVDLEELADGVLRMSRMQEIQKLEPGRPGPPAGSARRSVQDASFGGTKALYRGTPTQVTTPAAYLFSYQAAWETRNATIYSALLTDDFEFWVRDDDAGQFPWAPNDFWDRAEELGMVAHMFDDAYVGTEPPVTSIGFTYQILSTQELDEATTQLTLDASIPVLTGSNNGFRSDTHFVVDLARQAGGGLRMSRMQEVQLSEPASRSAEGRQEDSSFGAVKSLYR